MCVWACPIDDDLRSKTSRPEEIKLRNSPYGSPTCHDKEETPSPRAGRGASPAAQLRGRRHGVTCRDPLCRTTTSRPAASRPTPLLNGSTTCRPSPAREATSLGCGGPPHFSMVGVDLDAESSLPHGPKGLRVPDSL